MYVWQSSNNNRFDYQNHDLQHSACDQIFQALPLVFIRYTTLEWEGAWERGYTIAQLATVLGTHISKGMSITRCVTGTSISPKVGSDLRCRERCDQPNCHLCCSGHQQLMESFQGRNGGVGITVQQTAHHKCISLKSSEEKHRIIYVLV